MSDKDLARRTEAEVYFDGVDISASLRKYLISLTYTDYEEDQTDDLQIEIEDRDATWLSKWLNVAIQAAASGLPSAPASDDGGGESSATWAVGESVIANGQPQYTSYGQGAPGKAVTNYKGNITHLNLKSGVPYPIHVGYLGWFSLDQITRVSAGGESSIASSGETVKGLRIQAAFVRKNWDGDGKDKVLDCGKFELDSVEAAGPPATILIKGTALPFNSQIRQTKKSKAWEGYTLSRIANEMASKNRMIVMYESANDPYYTRVEQITISDIAFLSQLCQDAGISLKVSNNIIILFDQAAYEKKSAIFTIRRGTGSYTKYKLRTGEADKKYAKCRVSYIDPATGAKIEGIATVKDYNPKDKKNQTLEIIAKANNSSEAKTLAQKYLRLKNKYEYTTVFTLPGNPGLIAGMTIQLSEWGPWDGKYIVSQAKHIIGNSGYTTQIRLRHVLEGY